MKCSRCRKEYKKSFGFCPGCGQEKSDAARSESSVPPETAPLSTAGADPETGNNNSLTGRLSPLGWRQMLTVMVAGLAVLGWVFAGVVMKAAPETNETATEAVAEQLIQLMTDEDYAGVLDLADRSDDALLAFLLCEAAGASPGEIRLDIRGPELRDDPLAEEFASRYFPRTRKALLKSNIRSINSRKLVPDRNYLAAVFSAGRDEAFPVMVMKSNGTWKLDLASMLVVANEGMSTRYLLGSVDELLSEGDEKSVDLALELLEVAEGLEEKYQLWLTPEAEGLIPIETVSRLVDSSPADAELDTLAEEAREIKKGHIARREWERKPDGEQAMVSVNVITLSGSGSLLSDDFEINPGLMVLHYQFSGPGAVTLVDSQGTELAVFQISRAGAGSRALSLPPGIYRLAVQSSGEWSVGIEDPSPLSVPVPPLSFSWTGQLATGFFQVRGGAVVIEMVHDGAGPFVVTVMEAGGSAVYLAASEDGPFEGTRSVPLRSEVFYLLDVQSDSPWTINIR